MEGGGFHGYQKTTSNSSSSTPATGLKLSDINMRLAEMNQQYIMQQQEGKTGTNSTNINNSNIHASSNGTIHANGSDDNECMVREQDRFMPIANVIRIMRKILPPHAKISDDAKETIQECVSEYISFITGEANERCQREQRKTITAEDVLWAMSKLGFDDYIEPLTLYLHRYREMEGDRGSSTATSTSLMRSDSSLQLKQLNNNTTTSNVMMRGIDHHHQYYGIGTITNSSLAAAGAFHHHHQHSHGPAFFGYLKPPSADASTSNNNINNNATSAAQQQHPHGDHQHQHAT